MLPAATGQPEMVEAMRERLAGDGDAEAVGGGEIGQRLTTGIMTLREENLLVLAVKGAPFCDATLDCSANAVWDSVRTELILKILEDRHRHDAGDLRASPQPGARYPSAGRSGFAMFAAASSAKANADPCRCGARCAH